MRRGRSVWVAAVMLAVVVAATSVGVPPAAGGNGQVARDCAGDVGDPVSGTPEWDAADLNNQQCAVLPVIQNSPAVAAAVEANTAAGHSDWLGDPFRAPHRWAGQRGSYELTRFTFTDGSSDIPGFPPRPVGSAALFGPLDADGGPYPGVLLLCHACGFDIGRQYDTVEDLPAWYWTAQALAEAGYVVMYAEIFGNSTARAVDAADLFVATPDAPTSQGEFNPWHARLDPSRLGIVGHSGAAGVAIAVGNSDARFDAVVAWDPAGSFTMAGVTPRTPTMIQVADYPTAGPLTRSEKPTPAPGSKYTFFDTIRAAGVDTMQVGMRASTHLDWSSGALQGAGSIYGEQVATYYTLAWFDRYLAPARIPGVPPRHSHAVPRSAKAREVLSQVVARDALRRLTATRPHRFDRSSDVYSIGAGFFDERKADRAGDVEAGNVPITIRGIPIRNLLSFHYDSRYFLEGGALRCDDMRAGCRRG